MSHRLLRRLPALIIILLTIAPATLSAARKPDYDREVKRVQQQIAKGDLGQAATLVDALLRAYPDNQELLAMQARLHFWAGRHEESLVIYRHLLVKKPTPELRREMEKVETARDFALVERCRADGRYREMEELLLGLYRSRRVEYDAGLQLARFYQETKRWPEARDLLTAMVKTYPADQGLVELYVSSRVALVPPAPNVVKAQEAEPAPSPERPHPSPPLEPFAEYRARPNSLLVKVASARNTKGYPASTDTILELTQKVREWTVAPRFMVSRRFDLTNTEAGLDIYPPALHSKRVWGYLSFTVSPEGDYLPRWTAGGALYQGTGWGEFSVGYRRMHFSDSDVDIFSPGHSLVLTGTLALENKLYLAINQGYLSISASPGLIWEPSPRTKAHCRLTVGEEAEKVGPAQAVDRLALCEVRAGAEYRLTPAVSLSGELSWIDRERIYDSTGIMLGIRYWW
jgi:YaiO family outer membrane protein